MPCRARENRDRCGKAACRVADAPGYSLQRRRSALGRDLRSVAPECAPATCDRSRPSALLPGVLHVTTPTHPGLGPVPPRAAGTQRLAAEIGRATGRERGFQYV